MSGTCNHLRSAGFVACVAAAVLSGFVVTTSASESDNNHQRRVDGVPVSRPRYPQQSQSQSQPQSQPRERRKLARVSPVSTAGHSVSPFSRRQRRRSLEDTEEVGEYENDDAYYTHSRDDGQHVAKSGKTTADKSGKVFFANGKSGKGMIVERKSGKNSTAAGKSGKGHLFFSKGGKSGNAGNVSNGTEEAEEAEEDGDDVYGDGSEDVDYDDDTYNYDDTPATAKSSTDAKSGKESKSSKSSKSTKGSKGRSKSGKGAKSGDSTTSGDIRPSPSPSPSPSPATNRPTKSPVTNRPTKSPVTSSPTTQSPTTHPPSLSPTDASTTAPISVAVEPPTLSPTDAPTVPIVVRCGLTAVELREAWSKVASAVSTDQDLSMDGSPQSMALNWIVEEDGCFDSCPTDEKAMQRYILAVYYFSTNGDAWVECGRPAAVDDPICTLRARLINGNFGDEDSEPWLSCNHECLWGGVSCFPENDVDRSTCVDVIEFENNTLAGTFPNELSGLTDIRYLVNEKGQTSGSIPSAWNTLQSLRVLDLDYNRITGTLPDELYTFSKLIELDLDHNQITGTLSTSIGDLGRLRYLQLNNNTFTGTIPTEVGILTALVAAEFSNNQFTGEVPEVVCDNRKNVGGALELLIADCDVDNPEDSPRVTCTCCTSCRIG